MLKMINRFMFLISYKNNTQIFMKFTYKIIFVFCWHRIKLFYYLLLEKTKDINNKQVIAMNENKTLIYTRQNFFIISLLITVYIF